MSFIQSYNHVLKVNTLFLGTNEKCAYPAVFLLVVVGWLERGQGAESAGREEGVGLVGEGEGLLQS